MCAFKGKYGIYKINNSTYWLEHEESLSAKHYFTSVTHVDLSVSVQCSKIVWTISKLKLVTDLFRNINIDCVWQRVVHLLSAASILCLFPSLLSGLCHHLLRRETENCGMKMRYGMELSLLHTKEGVKYL